MKDFGILGLNARNLQYITRFNPKKQISFATNKFKTKEFLSQRGIPVPKTLAHITHRDQLFHTNFSKFKCKKFVVKPNRGSQGNGIYIVKDLEKLKLQNEENSEESVSFVPEVLQKLRQEIKKKYYNTFYAHLPSYPYRYRISGEWINDFKFKNKLVHTLDGQYRVGNKPDSILIEELIEPGEGFEVFCDWGLADIRIISFNLVPVAAMVRVPTEKSDGKANIAQGGIALGVEIATGRITSLSWKGAGKVFADKFPAEYSHFKDMKVPHWNDLLQLSANAQFFVNIGYVGLDWVITKKGPMLLEVNGRAGIEIQNITRQPLLKRMRKIDDMEIKTPKKGVEIAHALFNDAKAPNTDHQFVYLSQKATLSLADDPMSRIDVITLAAIKKKRNYVSASLMKRLDSDRILIHLPDSNIRAHINVYVSDNIHGNQIYLGTDFLAGYMLKTEHKAHPNVEFISNKNILEHEFQDLQILDQNLFSLNKKINLNGCLKPINYLSELDSFISKKGNYNPVFRYAYPSKNTIRNWRSGLRRLYDHHAGGTLLQSEFAVLMYDKMRELDNKIGLIEAYSTQNFDNIYKYNIALFGEFNQKLLKEAEKKVDIYEYGDGGNLGKMLSGAQVKKVVTEYLLKNKLENVPVYTTTRSMSRISVGYKHGKPFINLLVTDRGSFLEGKMEAKLVHEIDIHLMRYLNGMKTGWNIMTMGTAGYVKDEEGLAVWSAEQVMKNYLPEYESIAIYEKYLWLYHTQDMSFKELSEYVIAHRHDKGRYMSLSGIYNTCLKLKRGVQKTQIKHKGAGYLKDKVYLDGYDTIRKFVKKNGKIDERVMVGKIKLEDMDSIY